MRKNNLLWICLITIIFGATGRTHGATPPDTEINIDKNTDDIPATTTNDTYLFSSGGAGFDDSNFTNTIVIDNGDKLVIGTKADGSGKGFTFHTGMQIQTAGTTSTFAVTAPNGAKVDVSFGGLSLNNGGNATFGSSTGTGTVNVFASTLSADGSTGLTTMTFHKNSTVQFTGVTGNQLGGDNAVNLNMNGGKLGFGGAVTLAHGTINVTADSFLAAANGLTIDKASGAANAAIVLTPGKSLTILKNLDQPDALGSLTIGGTNGGTLTLNSGTLITGELVFADGAVLTNASGKINTGTLDITDTFNDALTVTTIATGLTTIDSGVVYTVNGATNEYKGGMLVQGTLQGDTSATTITLGSGPKNLATIEVEGGSIAAGVGGFTIKHADIQITEGGVNPTQTLDASLGKLDLSTSTITVNMPAGDVATINSEKGINTLSYKQLLGTVELTTSAAGDALTVKEKAVIGSSKARQPVVLDVAGAAADFAGGLALDKFGSIAATRDDGTVTVGSNGVSGSTTITASGNNQLYASGGHTLTFDNPTGANGKMNWNGKGNTVFGHVDQSGYDVTVNNNAQLSVGAPGVANGYEVGSLNVYGRLELGMERDPNGGAGGPFSGIIESYGTVGIKDGGVMTAKYSPAYVTNLGAAANMFKVDKGGILRADTASVNVYDFKSVDINGTFVAGLADDTTTPASSAHLIANSDVNISSSGLITMTADLAAATVDGTDETDSTILIEVDNTGGTAYKITNKGNMSSMSMLGRFEYGLNSDATILYVASASGKVILDGSDEDRQQALENLQDIWGKNQIKDDLGNVIYDVIKGDIVAEPEDSIAGNKNLNLLTSIGSPEGEFVGIDTLEYLNGAHLYGITDVAMETNRMFMSDISNRTKALNCSFVAAREVSGSDALASTAMNEILNNRMWFGGSGLKQDAKSKDGFSGYKYKSYGFVGGYDRVVAENVAGGFSFAYNKGDYEDKGAAKSDSDIESFSVGLYGTWSSPCGWFASGHGGYTYSQNDIRELRRDPDAGRYSWGESNFRTNTWSFGALFGYDIRLPESGLVLSPSVGLNYITAKNSDHNSRLDGIVTQRVTDAKNNALYAPVELGIQYDRCVGDEGKLRVELNAGYSYNFRDKGMSGSIHYFDLDPETSISLHGRDNAKHSYKLGGGTRYSFRTFDFGVRYDYMARSSYHAHRLMATAGLAF